MTTAVLPVPALPAVDLDDGFHHLFCCDEKRALCGVELGFVLDELDPEKICPMCEAIHERGEPCPHGGCAYTPAELDLGGGA